MQRQKGGEENNNGFKNMTEEEWTFWSITSWLRQTHSHTLPSVPYHFNWYLDDTSLGTQIDFA